MEESEGGNDDFLAQYQVGRMNRDIASRLADLDIVLPALTPPRFQYLPATRLGDLVFFSGRTPIVDGRVVHPGRLGESVSIQEGQEAARLAAVNVLASIEQELGLENVGRILKLTGFVASGERFTDQAVVIDAASTLLVDVLRESGRHARSAIGVAWLPGNAAIEIEVIVHYLPTID